MITTNEITKIITKGSIKKRAQLVAEEMALSAIGKKRILNENQYITLRKSFNTVKEKSLLETYYQYNDTIRKAITNIQGLRLEIGIHLSELKGFVLLWNYAEGMELLANSILSEIDDPKRRKEIAEQEAKLMPLLWAKIKADEEGYLDVKVDFTRKIYSDGKGNKLETPITTKEYTLYNAIQVNKKEAERAISKFLGWSEATLEYMDKRKFNIQAYRDLILEEMKRVQQSPIRMSKYTGVTAPGRLAKLMKIYKVMPDNVKADKEAYNWFKTNILKDDK